MKTQLMTTSNKWKHKKTELCGSVCVYVLCGLPCGSSGGTAADPQRADTTPGPEQCLHIY